MSLEMRTVLAARGLDLSLTIGAGETVALMGPNGAGKSSVVQLLAGLVRPDAGHARLAGRTLFRAGADGAGADGAWLPPHRRGIGTLAQQPLLFPHLSVLENVAFGPRSRGHSKAAATATARHWLAEVDAADWARLRPAQLSGGQAQRVALARALATEPDLLLLDEPLAALDVSVAVFMRSLLKRVLAGRSALIVTHDVLDTLLLADRILVVEGGRIVEAGPASAVLSQPRSAFAASLAGLNVLTGALTREGLAGTAVGLVHGTTAALDAGAAVTVGAGVATAPMAGVAAFRPAAVAVFTVPPAGSPRNCFAVTLTALERHGDHIRVRAGQLAADISPGAAAELQLSPGSHVYFVVKAAEVALYPA